jgi:hypothetical protein
MKNIRDIQLIIVIHEPFMERNIDYAHNNAE